jgi:hypothetical protein
MVDELAGLAAAFTGSAASDGAISQGTNILAHALPGDTAQAVATQAAAKTGLDPSALMALLPMVATMAASALGNGTGTVAQPQAGGLGGLLGGLLGGGAGGIGGQGGAAGALIAMIDTNKDGNPLDEIMGMLKR